MKNRLNLDNLNSFVQLFFYSLEYSELIIMNGISSNENAIKSNTIFFFNLPAKKKDFMLTSFSNIIQLNSTSVIFENYGSLARNIFL